eukprot:tig00020912_g15803.t1
MHGHSRPLAHASRTRFRCLTNGGDISWLLGSISSWAEAMAIEDFINFDAVNAAVDYVKNVKPAQIPADFENWRQWTLKNTVAHTKGRFLMDPQVVFACVAGYLAFVILGSVVMKAIKPFQLKLFSILHNVFLVGLSGYMCAEAIRQAVNGKYGFFCNAYDKSPKGQAMADIVYIFYVSKLYEFMDTVIMILRGKFNQVSFLHVYHHTTIFIIWWYIATHAPGGDAYYSTALNSFIHFVMYSYYLGTCLGEKSFIRRVTTVVKPHITKMQMFQFVTMASQAVYDLTHKCDYPRGLIQIYFWYMLSLLALFGNFYVQSYLKKPASRSKSASSKGKKAE